MAFRQIQTAGIADDAINSAKIGVDVIVAADLAANSVTVSEITDGAVTTNKIANAYGIKFVKISKTEEIDIKIDEILEYDGPVICEVIVPADQKIIPTVSSRVNDDGSMSSRPLEDMYPFLDRSEYFDNLYVDDV